MVLEEKMRLDQILQDGVVLKPFKDIIAAKVTDVDLGRHRAGAGGAGRLQADGPAAAAPGGPGRHAGDPDGRRQRGRRGRVPPVSPASPAGSSRPTELVAAGWTRCRWTPPGRRWPSSWRPRWRRCCRPSAPVVAIYINRDRQAQRPLPRGRAGRSPGLTRYHTGAWPLALDLFEEGRLSGPAVTAVKARLMELGQTHARCCRRPPRPP